MIFLLWHALKRSNNLPVPDGALRHSAPGNLTDAFSALVLP